jgi:ABC-type Fe3+-hydroxamate transport system substrate-binding protein
VRVEVVHAENTVEGARARVARVASILGRDPAPVLAVLDAEVAAATAFVGKTAGRPRALVVYARGAGALHVFGRGSAAEEMVKLAGAELVTASFEGTLPLTAEGAVVASADVIVVPTRGLGSLGGIDGLLALPGLDQTPAGRSRRVVAIDDLLLLGFGPRTGTGILELKRIEAIRPWLNVLDPDFNLHVRDAGRFLPPGTEIVFDHEERAPVGAASLELTVQGGARARFPRLRAADTHVPSIAHVRLA